MAARADVARCFAALGVADPELESALDDGIEAVGAVAFLEHPVAGAVADVTGAGALADAGLHRAAPGDRIEQPLRGNPHPGGEARHERQVVAAPEQPCRQAGEPDAVDLRHAATRSERGERALGLVDERLAGAAFECCGDVLRQRPGLAHGELRGRRRVMAALARGVDERDQRGVAERPDVVAALDAQGAVGPEPAALVRQRRAWRRAATVRCRWSRPRSGCR